MDELKKRLAKQRLTELLHRLETALDNAKEAELLALRMQLSSQQLRTVDVAVAAMNECFTGGEL